MSKIVKANMVSVTWMTRLILPQMVKRGKGVIINVGSVSSLIPQPLFAVYSASKAYMKKLTEDIIREYAGNGIIIQCAMPGAVVTKMSGLTKSSFVAPTAKTYVKSALGLVGTASITTGYLPHAMLVKAVKLMCKINSSLGEKLILMRMNEMKEREMKRYNSQ